MIRSLPKIWSLLDRQARLGLGVLGVVLLAAAILEMAGIGLFLPFLHFLIAPDTLPASDAGRALVEVVTVFVPDRSVMKLAFLLLGFFVFKNVVLLGVIYLQTRITRMGEAELSSRLFAAYLEKPWESFIGHNSADVVRNIISSTAAAFKGVLLAWVRLLTEAVLALAAGAILFAIEPKGTLAAAAVFALIFGGYFFVFRGRLFRWGEMRELLLSRRIRSVNEMVAALREIRVFGRERFFAANFRDLCLTDGRMAVRLGVANQAPRLIGEVATAATLIAVVVAVLGQGLSPAETVPVLGVFAAAALRILPAFNRVTVCAADIRQYLASVDNVYRSFTDAARASATHDSARTHFQRSLELHDVSYVYPGASVPAIANVSFALRRGEAVAMIGRSGAGKSTLADIVLGLLPPTAGTVSVDGTVVVGRGARWAGRVAYVSQTVVLLDESLRRNVAFGVPDGEIDDVRIHQAIERARLDEVVARLPDGLATILGERGARLSGGERQRVGIARALYVEPELIVLDEPASALDSETEGEIADMIAVLKKHCAVLVIAHRPRTVGACDRVVLLREGGIADAGAYADVMARQETLTSEIQ